jgi:hypothetical protein
MPCQQYALPRRVGFRPAVSRLDLWLHASYLNRV